MTIGPRSDVYCIMCGRFSLEPVCGECREDYEAQGQDVDELRSGQEADHNNDTEGDR